MWHGHGRDKSLKGVDQMSNLTELVQTDYMVQLHYALAVSIFT